MSLTMSDPSRNGVAQRFELVLQRLLERHDFREIDAAGFDDFTAGPSTCAVLLLDDPVQQPEVCDVAAVLPEVLTAAGVPMPAAFARAAAARVLQPRFGFVRWPAVVFLRAGRWVGTIEGMRDWQPFVDAVREMATRPVGRPPTVGIPLRVGGPVEPPACH